jgi:hypothetical protein
MSQVLTYSITDECFRLNGIAFAIGCWSGKGKWKNDPKGCDKIGEGPLPVGLYKLGKLVNHPRLGRDVIQLIPFATNEMHGRSDFWIHGASLNPLRYGQESMGCIIATKINRRCIAELGQDVLEVTE